VVISSAIWVHDSPLKHVWRTFWAKASIKSTLSSVLVQSWLYLHRRGRKITSDGGGTTKWWLVDGLARLEQGKEAEAGRDHHVCILVRGSKPWTMDLSGLQIPPLSNDWFEFGFSELYPHSDLGELINEGRKGTKNTLPSVWPIYSEVSFLLQLRPQPPRN